MPKHTSNNPIKRNIAVMKVCLTAICYGFKNDAGIRQWSILCPVLIAFGFYLGKSRVEDLILIIPICLIYIMEIMNTALEVTLDRITLEHDLMIKNAKDLGALAVFFAVALAIFVWITLIFF